ncbi:L-ribulose-5-phosphate 4-epimerase AraD [Vagococcus coleopterorum]|uniref:L-ribulose-5-phosphate 4-epimerase n=1 Tax=Vagococcus coleopterorum TaxID=2714946 RepID=A0A6G8APC4_9ENTE|nr:L-ribulose-5-phosphate 4-epimerase AraD [Vagococcus coleopterorum]QIL46819.1 L-ribulose-5-phosphate 4-epimerase AraD [Vagococcus coleopterorum]
MMSEEIIKEMKERVYRANLRLSEEKLIKLTWGNVSEINRELCIIVIKPSGVSYEEMSADKMVVTDLRGQPIGDQMKPSSDMMTHAHLYESFPKIGSIVHTHSEHAVMWAQAGKDIPAYGTTHADHFFGDVPCARELTTEEISGEYERNTGHVIVECILERGIDYEAVPAILVKSHGPFTWGSTTEKAVDNAVVLDVVAKMAMGTEYISKSSLTKKIPQYLLDKHYLRKHGKNAYYGQ